FHNIHLATLFVVVSGSSLEDSTVDKIVESLERFSQSDNGPWVFRVPDNVRDAYSEIASMDEQRIAAVARQWAATPEWEGWELDDVEAAARTIGDLADTAKWNNKSLWLWMGY